MGSRAQRRKLERKLEANLLSKKNTTEDIDLLYRIKYSLNKHQGNVLLNKTHKLLRGNLFPKKYFNIREFGKTYIKDNISIELEWYLDEILNNYKIINDFLVLQQNYENFLISGDYVSAEKVLDEVECEICVSDWSIENRLLLAEYKGGFKNNKIILAEILDDKNDPLTNVIAKYQSLKVEKQTSYKKYNDDFQNLIENLRPAVSEYLRYKLNFFSRKSYNYRFGFLLSIENPTSIIDKYIMFINIIMICSSDEQKNDLKTSLIKILLKLKLRINDVRLRNIILIIDDSFLPNLELSTQEKELINIFDNYTKGNYEKTIIELQNIFKNEYNILSLYIIYCKSNLYLGRELIIPFDNDSLSSEILFCINNILLKNDQSQQSTLLLIKIIHSLGSTSLGFQLFDFITNQGEENQLNHLKKLSFFTSKFLNPNFIFIFSNDENLKIKENLELEKSITYKLLRNINSKEQFFDYENEVDNYRLKKFKLKKAIKFKNHKESLQLFIDLENDKFRYYNNLSFNLVDFINNKIKYYYEIKNLQLVLETVVTANLINTNYKHGFNVKKLIEACLKDNDLKSNINSPILLHQYLNLLSTPKKLWIALDNFLTKNKLKYPKEVVELRANISDEKLIYFLKNICTQDIYDSSTSFESKDELDIERIEICTLLSELDKDNFEEYVNEVSEIDRQLLIKKGVKQIDESKIYVDVNGLKKSLYKDINESLQRSLSLQSLSIDQLEKLNIQDSSVLITYFDQNAKGLEQKDSNIKITGYSRFQNFTEMFCRIRDNFIANNEYGIDTYLSMRIRHGTLLGELRSIFERYYLITKKEDDSMKYKENIYWKKIEIYDANLKILFNDFLASFSKKIDTISNKLKNEKIQIKTENKETEGFFDYSYTKNDLYYLFGKKFGAIDNTDIFIEEILNVLWQRTENNLNFIRNYISNDLKNEITGYLLDLNKELDGIIDKYQYPEYNELIRNITTCQTDVRNELDKIASWFKRTNSKSINDFNIELPIDSTLITVKRIYKEYSDLEVNKIIKSKNRIEGEYFQHFCYIFQNLIHNILEHSKLDSENLTINFEIEEDDEFLIIAVENNFSQTVNVENLKIKIAETIKLLENEGNSDKIRAESGTGYLKIQKTLDHDLKRSKFEIIIYVTEDNNMFKTLIKMNKINLFKLDNA